MSAMEIIGVHALIKVAYFSINACPPMIVLVLALHSAGSEVLHAHTWNKGSSKLPSDVSRAGRVTVLMKRG